MSRNLPKVLQIGLVGWWDSAGKDLSGNGNNGTLVNSPTKVRRLQNDGLKYNGSSQYLDFGNLSLAGNTYSISTWINPNLPSSGAHDMIMSKYGANPTNTGGYYHTIYNNSGTIQIQIVHFDSSAGGAFTEIIWNVPLIAGKLYHIVCTWDGSNSRLYVNSVLISAQANTRPVTNTTSTMYSGRDAGGNYYGGAILNPMVYYRALSQKEIELLYNSLYIK